MSLRRFFIFKNIHASGEGERVIAPEPWEGTLASQRRLIYKPATVGCECVRFSVLASFLGKWYVVLILEPETARSLEPGAKVP